VALPSSWSCGLWTLTACAVIGLENGKEKVRPVLPSWYSPHGLTRLVSPHAIGLLIALRSVAREKARLECPSSSVDRVRGSWLCYCCSAMRRYTSYLSSYSFCSCTWSFLASSENV